MKNLSIRSKISAVVLLVSLVSSLFIGAFSYYKFSDNLTRYLGIQAQNIAQTVSAGIDGDQISYYDQGGTEDAYYAEMLIFLDKVKKSNNLTYLYIMTDGGEVYKYIAEAPSDDEAAVLGETDTKDQYGSEPMDVLTAGAAVYTEIYPSTNYGNLLSGFAPVFDSAGNAVALVGVDIGADIVNDSINRYLPYIVLITLLSSALSFLVIFLVVNRIVIKPIRVLDTASNKLIDSEFSIDIPDRVARKRDELGHLAQAFIRLSGNTQKIISDIALVLSEMSAKNLTVEITDDYKGDFMEMKNSINNIAETYNVLLGEFGDISRIASTNAKELSGILEDLAQGSVRQSDSIGQLTSALLEISNESSENARNVADAKNNMNDIAGILTQGNEQMKQTLSAMEEIKEASDQISRVLKVINDITFQTNILALNAAVEAARAGEHGKGFAVVAEEVRDLANRTSEAAKQTEDLISTSISAVKNGVSITKETAVAIEEVFSKTRQITEVIDKLSNASSGQASAISEIMVGMNEISEIIQANARKAQDSAANSEKLNEQAERLFDDLSKFQIR